MTQKLSSQVSKIASPRAGAQGIDYRKANVMTGKIVLPTRVSKADYSDKMCTQLASL
jgi:hypothetical protein